jgi:flap endonuclease-1
MAILIGTDFNKGIRGIGPKTALKLIKEHGRLEDLPVDIRCKVDGRYEEVRAIFLKPEVTSEYDTKGASLRENELYKFLCDEKGFSRVRVENAVNRIKVSLEEREQPDLGKWL